MSGSRWAQKIVKLWTAGGDVKLFTALGALLPRFYPPYSASYSSSYPLFPVTILLNGLILAVPVLLVYAVICHLRGRGALYENVKITNLEKGMIPAETIYEKDGEIGRFSSTFGRKPRGIAPTRTPAEPRVSRDTRSGH